MRGGAGGSHRTWAAEPHRAGGSLCVLAVAAAKSAGPRGLMLATWRFASYAPASWRGRRRRLRWTCLTPGCLLCRASAARPLAWRCRCALPACPRRQRACKGRPVCGVGPRGRALSVRTPRPRRAHPAKQRDRFGFQQTVSFAGFRSSSALPSTRIRLGEVCSGGHRTGV